MNWESFKDKFHVSWHDKIKPFIESAECDAIYAFLKQESQKGKKIAPASVNTFRCFKETPLTSLKLIIMGMCPYHTFINGEPVADGLLMGCSITKKIQPSLDQFYSAIDRDYYKQTAPIIKDCDVSYLAKQGILMLNAALTTEKDKAGSHIELWEPFIKYLYENIINDLKIPTVFLGKDASKYVKYCDPFTWSYTLTHPASASYKKTEWSTEGVFAKIDSILEEKGEEHMMWLKTEVPF